MLERYEDDRLYCTACPEQPDYFNEVMAWQINQVAPDGTVVRMKDAEVSEYRCWNCNKVARWGHELNP
jgi:hypothetical protein